MKTNRKFTALIISLLSLLFWNNPTAAFPTKTLVQYEVAWLDGSFWVQPTGQFKWQEIKKLTEKLMLSPTDKIKLGSNTQLIVRGSDGSAHLLNKAGVWRLQQLIEQPSLKTPSAVKQYLGFLLKHINHSEKNIDTYAEAYMRKKGLVSRGPGVAAPLMRSPQFDSRLEANQTTFIWKSMPNTTTYSFTIYEDWRENSEPIWSKTVTDSTLSVNLDQALIERDRTYYWSVFPNSKRHDVRYTFKRIKPEELQVFEQKMAELQSQAAYGAAMNSFLKAGLYEENLFLPEANQAFLSALKIAPSNRLFKESYVLFLARNGQVEEAKKFQ
jgi:hypothetical protein